MKIVLIVLSLVLSMSVYGKTYNQLFSKDSFYNARTSLSFLRFEAEGTRLGVFPADFFGIAKTFQVEVKTRKSVVRSAKVTFPLESLDTDLAVRNKRMRNFCFNIKKYPEVTIVTKNSFRFNVKSQNVKAIMKIRGRDKPLMLKINSYRDGKRLIVKGTSKVKLTELEIPDPSAFANKVKDEIEIRFNIAINL